MAEHLFLYGTLRRSFDKPIHHFITQYASYVDDGTIQGKLYNLGTYPGAMPSDEIKNRVFGEVYVLHQPEIVFEKLDVYEGEEYRREAAMVTLQSNKTQTAWVYWLKDSVKTKSPIESGDYLKFLASQLDNDLI